MQKILSSSSGRTLSRPLQGLIALVACCIFMLASWLVVDHDIALIRMAPAALVAVGFGLYSLFLLYRLEDQQQCYRSALSDAKDLDKLTGLANRQVFRQALYLRLRAPEKQKQPFAILLLDIDRFKELDTILGSESGDLLLVEFANRLLDFQSDDRLVARLSGGFSIFPEHGYRVGPLLQQAKLALLRAKQQGRDQICRFEQHHDAREHIDHELSQEMGKAIARRDFCLHYQPQFCSQTGRQLGFEALLRWNHPVRGLVSPGSFIPLAEKNGLILPLSEFALREACRAAANWKQPMRVAVNLSPVQFHKTDLVSLVKKVLQETGLPAERLELEVTESLFIQHNQRTIDTLKHLQKLGVSIALDDFGTGYSSLSYLSAFPIDKIKIDRSFVMDLATNEGNMAIISAMIGIAKSLDLQIIAEGIEDKQTLEILRLAGCHEVQGFLLGRPRDLAREPGIEMVDMLHRTISNPASYSGAVA